MNIDQNGNTCMTIDQFRNVAFSSNENNSFPVANNETHLMIFFLIRDIKGVFQLIGRSGCNSSYCMLCKCRPKVWKELYSTGSGAYADTCVNAEKWTIGDIKAAAISQN